MTKLKNFLTDSCILFTVFVFILYIAGRIFVSPTLTITLEAICILFSCCLLLRVFHNVLHIEKLPITVRILMHYALVLAAAYVGFALIAKIVSNSLATFVLLSVVTAIYSAVAAVTMLIRNKNKEKDIEKKEYKSILK